MSGPTPSQTVGPFFSFGLLWNDGLNRMVAPETAGQPIRLEGRVSDGDGEGMPDALLEVWQADASGIYHHPLHEQQGLTGDPTMTGFGRSGTDAEGFYAIDTIMPGVVQDAEGRRQSPHLNLIIFARGLLDHLMTRVYFSEDGTEEDPVLSRVPPERRGTLIAERAGDGEPARFRFDIVLQGPGETVFLEV